MIKNKKVRFGHLVLEFVWDLGFGICDFNIKHANIIAPIVMALSATLKTGQMRKSKKSTTYPKNKRSMRLPNAPANMRLKEIL